MDKYYIKLDKLDDAKLLVYKLEKSIKLDKNTKAYTHIIPNDSNTAYVVKVDSRSDAYLSDNEKVARVKTPPKDFLDDTTVLPLKEPVKGDAIKKEVEENPDKFQKKELGKK